MRSISNGTNQDDSILRRLWPIYLPANIAACLAIRNYSSNLDELVEITYRIQETYIQFLKTSKHTGRPQEMSTRL
nr:hypothetical transcript [Hymenolepis microstoma]